MKILVLAASLGLLAAGSSAASDPREAPRAYLRGAQCLDPAFARGWEYLDDRHILVDGGRNRYRIEFRGRCLDVASTPVLGFRGDPISGRVCGSGLDTVITRDLHCAIQRMDLISREEYKAILVQRARDRAERRAARRRART